MIKLIQVVLMSYLTLSCTTSELSQEFLDMNEIITLVDEGAYAQARKAIQDQLTAENQPSIAVRDALAFELERMSRIERDFRAQPEDVYGYIREYYPELSDADIQHWESTGALEFKIIDGEKRYFARAGRNLFRIDAAMRKHWEELHPDAEITSGSGAKLDLDLHNARVIEACRTEGNGFVEPKRLAITQSVIVDADVVPPGEAVRCWIPYPRNIMGRQDSIIFKAASPETHVIAPESALQRTIFFEQTAQAGQPLTFSVSYEMTTRGTHQIIEAERVSDVSNDPALAEFLAERPPHITFTPELQALSREIIGDETNPYRKAQLLFEWVDENIPWASAREYSTIRKIPQYAFTNGHGDCGIQTLLFMTLCRMNGIPTRWQSGWELQPPHDSMHDWGMIYFGGYGWVPMDITYGLRKSEDPYLKWFYLSGMDSYRIIFNDDYSQPFLPPKTHFRSETVDSQRGEVEWDGGNLYFNEWSWDFKWEVLNE